MRFVFCFLIFACALNGRTPLLKDGEGHILEMDTGFGIDRTEYNDRGLPVKFYKATGDVIEYGYDELSRMSSIDSRAIHYRFSHNDHHQLTEAYSLEDDSWIRREYDDHNRLISETTPQGRLELTYTEDDLLETITLLGKWQLVYSYGGKNEKNKFKQIYLLVS